MGEDGDEQPTRTMHTMTSLPRVTCTNTEKGWEVFSEGFLCVPAAFTPNYDFWTTCFHAIQGVGGQQREMDNMNDWTTPRRFLAHVLWNKTELVPPPRPPKTVASSLRKGAIRGHLL